MLPRLKNLLFLLQCSVNPYEAAYISEFKFLSYSYFIYPSNIYFTIIISYYLSILYFYINIKSHVKFNNLVNYTVAGNLQSTYNLDFVVFVTFLCVCLYTYACVCI